MTFLYWLGVLFLLVLTAAVGWLLLLARLADHE
jgi:hypothetical protein